MNRNILNEIVERNRTALEQKKQDVPFEEVAALAASAPECASFTEAFRDPGIHVIAELKKASPSKGMIRENLDVPVLAASLTDAGAAALSVLTEPFYFKGGLENLRLASEAVSIPLLRKDFIFDPYQILEAKVNGASAILLIAAMLSADEFKRLLDFAHRYSLAVLGEAHTESELEIASSADLVGVNARDLKTFSTSLERSAELIATLKSCGKPVIAESAVRTHEDILMLRNAGAAGFLIGETLMRADDPGAKLKELLQCC
ncbi:MAG: indole-3-glycerol phosphate synthase TrpC [Lentisphaeria bacterium]|nr:indole-3-glycerol phosphate synthase TrpC [Lentisphaeria bacterium]